MLSKKTVMIVDDDEDIQKIVRRLLLMEDYQVVVANSGPTCLELLKQQIPDLILLDQIMPGMDGIAVLQEIKKHQKYNVIPISLFTSKKERELIQQAVNAGVADFIVKPFDPKKLVNRIKRHLLTLSCDEVRTILKTINFADPLLLKHKQLSHIDKTLYDAYPVAYQDVRLCLIIAKNTQPSKLASMPDQEIIDRVTIYRESLTGWKVFWHEKRVIGAKDGVADIPVDELVSYLKEDEKTTSS